MKDSFYVCLAMFLIIVALYFIKMPMEFKVVKDIGIALSAITGILECLYSSTKGGEENATKKRKQSKNNQRKH